MKLNDDAPKVPALHLSKETIKVMTLRSGVRTGVLAFPTVSERCPSALCVPAL